MDKYPFRVIVYFGTKRPIMHSFETLAEAWKCHGDALKRPAVSGADLSVILCKTNKNGNEH